MRNILLCVLRVSYENPFFDTEVTENTEGKRIRNLSEEPCFSFFSVNSVSSVSKFLILRGVQSTWKLCGEFSS